MALLRNSAEAGVANGTAVSVANSAAPDAWSAEPTTTAATVTYSTTASKGTLSIAHTFAGTTGAAYCLWSQTGARTGAIRFYFRKTGNPSASGVGLVTLGSSGTAKYANLVMNTSGAIALYDYAGGYYGAGTSTFTSGTMSNDTWYRIEISLDNSGGSAAGAAVVKVYTGDGTSEIAGLSFTTSGLNYGTNNIAKVYWGRNFGSTDTHTQTFFYDDIGWADGTTTLLGPTNIEGYLSITGAGSASFDGDVAAGTTNGTLTRVGTGTVSLSGVVSGTVTGELTREAVGSVTLSGTVTTPAEPVVAEGSLLDSTAILGGSIKHLWGLQETGSGTTVAGDVSGIPGAPSLTLTQYGSGGTAEFGTTGVVPEGSAVLFTPESASNGLLLDGTPPLYVGAEFSLFAQFAWDGSTGVDIVRIGRVDATGPRVVLRATPSQVQAILINEAGTTRTAAITTPTREGPHLVALVAASAAFTLYVDDETPVTVASPGSMGTIDEIHVGSVFSADPVRVAWVGFADHAMSATTVADLAAIATGGSERSDERVSRIHRWLGIDGDLLVETGLSDVGYQPTLDRQGLDVIGEVADVEQGVFFPTGDGRFVWHARDHRYNDDVSFALSAADVNPDVQVMVDLAQVVNDVAASRPGGATYRALANESVQAYGPRTKSVSLYTADDDDLAYAAQAMVNRYSQPAPRVPEITVNLLAVDADTARGALGVQIGDLIQVTNLPDSTPGGTTLSLYVEGVSETLSATSWSLTWATSPGVWSVAWVLDSDDYSNLGTTTVLAY